MLQQIDFENFHNEDFVYMQLGMFYTDLLFEAETSNDGEDREHARWLRSAIMKRLATHNRHYN